MSPSPVVTDVNGYLVEDYLSDEYLDGELLYGYGLQAQMVVGSTKVVGQQAQMVVHATKVVGQQALMLDAGGLKTGHQQAEMVVHSTKSTGMSAKADTLRHALCESYLEDAYLSGPYLATCVEAFPGLQAKMIVKKQTPKGQQAKMVIAATKVLGQQAKMIVHATKKVGFQVRPIQIKKISLQATMVIYNDTQLRILSLFTSRGTAALLGNNWTATNQASGDFLPRNLNTDIEEQVFRSAVSSVELVVDTGVVQGVTIDTIALRNHNMTREATITVQGSTSPTFATIATSFSITSELVNSYYIAPTFPTGTDKQNRYWKFIIDDPTNAAGYVQIGAIIFGNSHIFSTFENYENPLVQGLKHFKDSLQTEGFTAVMNDRALRKWIRIRFTDLERINGNFRLLQQYIEYARTSLKCLVIATPKYASRFAVFAKLASMPEMEHRNVSNLDDPDGAAEYITLALDLDESL